MSWIGAEEEDGAASILAEEQREAVRLLLTHPFVSDTQPDPDTFALVRRHARELQRWFGEQLGYRLVVETEFARLHKRPAPGARLRPLRTQSQTSFDPRRYALLCLVLAALERVEVQTILSELAGQVALLAASEEEVRSFDLESFAERQAFVDVVRWLVEQGVLALADGEDTAFVEGRGDALYDVHSRRLAQLLSAPVPAAAMESAEPAAAEAYPDTEEGANRRARHRLMRRLVEEPVLYLEELEETERTYLTSQRHYLLGQVGAWTGLAIEVRREGLAAVDPAGRLSDLSFPATGTLSHAALLLAAHLAERARAASDPSAAVPEEELLACMDRLLAATATCGASAIATRPVCAGCSPTPWSSWSRWGSPGGKAASASSLGRRLLASGWRSRPKSCHLPPDLTPWPPLPSPIPPPGEGETYVRTSSMNEPREKDQLPPLPGAGWAMGEGGRGGEVGRGALPLPLKQRFQPLRAGILNLWQYDEQEFRFHDGRLILRGENGSGKSKALEVLLPFLFDADLSPQRLDPFGGTSRTMEWNLLQDGRFESRVGYVWLELGRLGEEGVEVPEIYWTLGCGLRATGRTRRVDAWYFLTRHRVGRDLHLLSPQRIPLLKDQLRQQIGEEGWVFDTGRDYREKLDTQIFGLGEDRFATLRHLLLQLRRPHLSERLDPATLSEILKESLPPLDPDLIGQLSEGFERLDNEQKELVRVESAVASVASFLETYREYGRGIARARSAEVRQTDSRYHKTAAEAREAEEERERLDARLADLAEHESALDTEIAAVRGALRALEQSDAMRSAEALRAKREHAEALRQRAGQEREDALREERRREERRRDQDAAEAEERRMSAQREEAAHTALAAAREAGLEGVAESALEALATRVTTAEALVRAAVHRREEAITELRRLVQDRDQARRREEGSEERLREADARLRQAVARTLAARAEVERRQQDLESALAGWRAGLEELSLDEAGLEILRSCVAMIADSVAGRGGDLTAAVAALVTPRRDALVRERTALEEEASRTAAEQREMEDERQRVESARELGPEPPRTRASDRTERPGAPLYLLCEFAEGLDAAEQAGLEAALEASGLLDAWVSPDGGVLAPGTLDTFLVPAPRGVEGPTLADLLRPAPGHGVDRAVIKSVLRSISVASAGDGAPVVRADGAFQLGPLRGAWDKPVAEHVGAGAREEARARRLVEIATLLDELARRIGELETRLRTLDARLARLDREAAAVPSTALLARAVHQEEAATDDEIRRRAERETIEVVVEAARAARQAAEHRLAARARELDLAGWIDDLEGARFRLARFEAGFRDLVRATAAAGVASERAERARRLLEEAVSREAELLRRAQESTMTAQAALAEHAMLEATVGTEVREVVERQRTETRRLDDLGHRRRRLAEDVQTDRELRARVRERLELRQLDLAEREAERAQAVVRLGRLVDAGLLPLVLGADLEPPAAWSLTRALELAREIEKETAGVDLAPEAANRRVNRLHERFRLLTSDLGAEYQPSLDQDEDLASAWVGYNGREHGVAGLLDTLRENLEVRRGLLAEHERDLLRRYLLGEVGDHLRHRLRQARALVEDMNQLLEECRTASGLTLKLAWEPIQESAPEIRDAVQLLRQDLALLADTDRRRLEAFFQARISEARQQWEAVPWREHLMKALDYRGWFRFRILRRLAEDHGERAWVELTRRGHGASSGGEKAVALHLPLFAAAAAHYRSALATAPRVILLDEAFAGIDQRMRGRCMGLLVDFDLDFLMTSHEEWGCHEELPGVATYQLYRDPALDGVAAVRFVWSGRRLREEPE